MPNNVFLTALGFNALFLASGCLLIGFGVVIKDQMNEIPTDGQDAVRHLVCRSFPLTAGLVNGALVCATFVFTLVGLLSPVRAWLKAGGYLITLCGLFTLVLGVYLWIMTLRLKADFFPTYLEQQPGVQALIQQSFQCCGYYNATMPAFVTDTTCPSPAAAALLRGCGTSISTFANAYIDTIFTSLFGMVGLDAMLVLAIVCLLKDRKERNRYRHIDEKSGYHTF